jgi:hypothetical protein
MRMHNVTRTSCPFISIYYEHQYGLSREFRIFLDLEPNQTARWWFAATAPSLRFSSLS